MTAEDLAEVVAQTVHAATGPLCARIAALEALLPTPGPIGPPGPVGLPGPDGRDGHDGRDGLPGVPGAPGTKGMDGRDGKDGAPGAPGTKGMDGRDGKDGAPGAPGKAGVDGRHGKDGVDGLGFDDLDVIFDPEHGYQLEFKCGELVKRFPLAVPFDASTWEAGHRYPKGAGVTVKGAWWIAQADTTARPGDDVPASRAWRLAVKPGRDGKDGKDGKAAE